MHTTQHPAGQALTAMIKGQQKARAQAALDSAAKAEMQEECYDAAGDYVSTDIALKVAASIGEFAETMPGDLDEGEGLADRFAALMVGIADADFDGEIGESESAVLDMALESAWDYLAGKGVPDADIDALLNNWDNDVATRVQELLAGTLPDGDEAMAEDMDTFAFGDGADEAAMDAVYKKKMVIRGGKKMRVNKRISGTVRLSARQKVSIRKASRKSHSATATIKRAKSNRIRRRAGL